MAVHHPHFTKLYVQGQKLIESVVGNLRQEQNQRASGRTLIIGAGTGLDVPHLGADVNDIVLLEPDSSMRRHLGQLYPNIDLLDNQAEAIATADESYDTVISSLVLCSVEDVQQVLAEIYRVLRPGGRFLFMEHVRHQHVVANGVQNLLNPAWKRIGGGCNLNRDLFGEIHVSPLQLTEYRLAKPNFLIPIVTGSAAKPL